MEVISKGTNALVIICRDFFYDFENDNENTTTMMIYLSPLLNLRVASLDFDLFSHSDGDFFITTNFKSFPLYSIWEFSFLRYLA